MHHVHHVASKYLLWLLLAVYALAAMFPDIGLALRSLHLFSVPWAGAEGLKVTLTSGLLAVLLFNAGLCMNTSELVVLLRRPGILFFGIVANIVFPCVVIFLFHFGLNYWHNSSEVQIILESLAIVIAMPIAGASTAWAQNSNGNVALSLGLVIFSTLLSPITTPLTIDFISSISTHGMSSEFKALQDSGIGSFLTYIIVIPSLLGIGVHRLLGQTRTQRMKDGIKILNIVILLVLNYSNAATSLPEIIRVPDWDFLGLVLFVTGTLCATGFTLGWLSSGAFRVPRSERVSLMYGLGMNNNGSALVIAATVFPGKPMLLLPIIAYNLLQHVTSGIANFLIMEVEELDPEPVGDIQFPKNPILAKSVVRRGGIEPSAALNLSAENSR